MAKRIVAIRKYRPQIKLERTMQTPQLVEDIAMHTGLNTGEILFVVYELRDAILTAHQHGQPVKVEGLGTFTPTIRMDGSLDILFRPEPSMLNKLNDRTKLYATILNKANIGKTTDDFVAKWNKEQPDNLVED
jgi:hypothetical protein